MIGPMALGIMCQKMMRESRAPEARAASTNSFSFSDRNTPRTIRASGIQKNSERIRTVWKRLPPGTNLSMKREPISSTTKNGMARNRSVTRIRRLSSHPP